MHSNAIRNSVIVITGGTSGIGLATATALAEKGAQLVLVARGQGGLGGAARTCESRGAKVLTVAADVTKEPALHEVVQKALAQFGRIDVWINNAGVLMYGKLVDAPIVAWRRVVETNLFGYVHGARAVLPVFIRQRRGILINNASSLGLVGMPYTSSYVASKFAVIGLSECLRLEVDEYEDIHVCTLAPPAADTPIYLHAANWTGHDVGPVPLVYNVQSVAKAMVELVEHPRPTHDVGVEDAAIRLGLRAMPALVRRVAGFVGAKLWVRKGLAERTLGNLFEPQPPHEVSGGFGPLGKRRNQPNEG
ncbi:MAG TPA: SDR family NAD(P)-dependent oxidoreductase [Polyangium sp.]|nr:SDR family NAD(P)-dependent oxidoreductase [Polyangium sp.]